MPCIVIFKSCHGVNGACKTHEFFRGPRACGSPFNPLPYNTKRITKYDSKTNSQYTTAFVRRE